MKTKISFVLVAFLILSGSAISEISLAAQPNKPGPKKTQVSITVPFTFIGGTFPNFTFEGPFTIDGAIVTSGTAKMDATVNINFMVYHCVWTLTDANGTITLHEQCEMGSTPVKGRWEIVSGTGDYANLRGNGSALMPELGDGLNWELLTGVIYK